MKSNFHQKLFIKKIIRFLIKTNTSSFKMIPIQSQSSIGSWLNITQGEETTFLIHVTRSQNNFSGSRPNFDILVNILLYKMQESDFFNQKVYLTRDMLKTLVHFSFLSLFSFNLYFIKTQIYPEYFATTEGKIRK